MFGKLTDKTISKKIKSFNSIDGWLTENEAIALFKTARKLKRNAVVVEIGSWQGKSTFCIAKGLKSGKVFAIDPFNADASEDVQTQNEYDIKSADKNLLQIFKNNMTRFSVMNKVIIKQGYSLQFKQEFNAIDFLFIDGDHSIKGCTADFEMYADKIIEGGFIAFHDYYKDHPELGPTHVINNIIPQSNKFSFIEQYDSLWVGKKSA